MAKYKIQIKRVEYFMHTVVVEAYSPTSAVKKVEEAWQKDSMLWEETTACIDDAMTDFQCAGLASKEETEYLTNIE